MKIFRIDFRFIFIKIFFKPLKTMKKLSFFLIIPILVILIFSCKKTDTQDEKLIIGTWITNANDYPGDSTKYVFASGGTGSSSQDNETDAFSWNIKGGYLNTSYKTSPHYLIGNDKYNSIGMYKVDNIKSTTMELVQFLADGSETTHNFRRLK